MTMFALIFDGIVQQVSAAEYWVAEGFTWVDVSNVSPTPDARWTASETSGTWAFSPPVYPAVSLPELADQALNGARRTVYDNFGILNEPTPDAWVTYIKALMAIASGTDTTSTSLPDAPAI